MLSDQLDGSSSSVRDFFRPPTGVGGIRCFGNLLFLLSLSPVAHMSLLCSRAYTKVALEQFNFEARTGTSSRLTSCICGFHILHTRVT